MKWQAIILLTGINAALLFCNACRPEPKKDIGLSAVPDTTELKALADSGNFFNQDGLDYEPLNTGTYDQLPPELTDVLNKKVPGWSLPFISREYLQQTSRNATGPYFIEADLNQDSIRDYAVQYLLQDTIFIMAYLKAQDGQLHAYTLSKYPFNSKEDKEESKLYLSLLAKGKEIITNSVPEKKKIIAPQNAIAVDSPNQSDLFFFNGQQINRLAIRSSE